MICSRCKNRMYLDYFINSGDRCFTWTCIKCGNAEDDIILANRKLSKSMAEWKNHEESSEEKD